MDVEAKIGDRREEVDAPLATCGGDGHGVTRRTRDMNVRGSRWGVERDNPFTCAAFAAT